MIMLLWHAAPVPPGGLRDCQWWRLVTARKGRALCDTSDLEEVIRSPRLSAERPPVSARAEDDSARISREQMEMFPSYATRCFKLK